MKCDVVSKKNNYFAMQFWELHFINGDIFEIIRTIYIDLNISHVGLQKKTMLDIQIIKYVFIVLIIYTF